MSEPIVFLDTETDGVHPGRKVWEVAMIRRDNEGERETRFFVDIDLSTADPFGLNVGGFYNRHPLGKQLSANYSNDSATARGWEDLDYRDRRESLTSRAAAMRVSRWTHGAHIVGAVPNFDTEVLAKLLRDNGLTPAWHYHLVDVEAMALGYLARCKHDEEIFLHNTTDEVREHRKTSVIDRYAALTELPYKSDELSRACSVEPPSPAERHTALGDARWCQRWYDALSGSIVGAA